MDDVSTRSFQFIDLQRENLQQRTELIEANSQALRELKRQEFIIRSYIPDEYMVRVTDHHPMYP